MAVVPRLYQKELSKTGFQIFESICGLGYFGWKPHKGYRSLLRIDSETIKSQVDVDAKPDKFVPLTDQKRLPLTFEVLSPLLYKNRFPYGQHNVASLFVATHHRGLNMDEIDFVFGGSTLDLFARHEKHHTFMGTKIPGTSTILVAKRHLYTQNYASFGFQFEHFVTGKSATHRHDLQSFLHLHVMMVGPYRVLFHSEVDAIMDDEPVEVTTSKSRLIKKIFQMISNGSPWLCRGVHKNNVLESVKLTSLSEVAESALMNADPRVLEDNILMGMEYLESQLRHLQEGVIHQITFTSSGSLSLIPQSNRRFAILPSAKVTKDLILHRRQAESHNNIAIS